VNRAEDWLKQAHRDLAAARASASAGYHEWAAFQAQQCAEKAAKALVQSLHGSVGGHSVTDILSHLLHPLKRRRQSWIQLGNSTRST
jgi:HEPN domain-containing protein